MAITALIVVYLLAGISTAVHLSIIAYVKEIPFPKGLAFAFLVVMWPAIAVSDTVAELRGYVHGRWGKRE